MLSKIRFFAGCDAITRPAVALDEAYPRMSKFPSSKIWGDLVSKHNRRADMGLVFAACLSEVDRKVRYC
jgi:hypothetical protein